MSSEVQSIESSFCPLFILDFFAAPPVTPSLLLFRAFSLTSLAFQISFDVAILFLGESEMIERWSKLFFVLGGGGSLAVAGCLWCFCPLWGGQRLP